MGRSAALLITGAVAVWVVMCGVGWLLVHPLTSVGFTHREGGVDRWFAAHRCGGWNGVTNAASLAGDAPAAIEISMIAFVVLRLTVHRWREPVLTAVSMLIVLSIGMSRLYRGMHYPTDIAGGILLGLLWISVISLVIPHGHSRRQALA